MQAGSGKAGGGGAAGGDKVCGIGLMLRLQEGNYYVEKMVAGGPAHLSNKLVIGDCLVEVDRVPTCNKKLPDVLELLRGPFGSVVVLTLFRRQGQEDAGYETVHIERGDVPRGVGANGAAPTPRTAIVQIQPLVQVNTPEIQQALRQAQSMATPRGERPSARGGGGSGGGGHVSVGSTSSSSHSQQPSNGGGSVGGGMYGSLFGNGQSSNSSSRDDYNSAGPGTSQYHAGMTTSSSSYGQMFQQQPQDRPSSMHTPRQTQPQSPPQNEYQYLPQHSSYGGPSSSHYNYNHHTPATANPPPQSPRMETPRSHTGSTTARTSHRRVIKEGWMLKSKRGGMFASLSLRDRFFQLEDDSKLVYYQDAKATQPINSLDLTKCTGVKKTADRVKGRHGMILIFPWKTYHLWPPTPAEHLQWASAIASVRS